MNALKKGWIPRDDKNRPSIKQQQFLTLPDFEAFYGGAAGGGKSDALLMGAVMFCHVPGYAAILFRKTLRDHQLPEGLIPRAHEWWANRAKWKGDTNTYHFPAGSSVTFGYMDSPLDHLRYQSSAYQYVGFDEVPQHRESQVRYMFSRLRRTEKLKEYNVPLRMRNAGNPDGPYVQWVKRRYVDYKTAVAPFIPAKIADNPGLDQETYIKSLMHLDPVTRARLMDGNWDIRDVGRMFRRSWFTIQVSFPSGCRAVRYWDKAASEAKPGTDPSYTAGVLVAMDTEGRFYILDIRHTRGTPGVIEDLIKQTAILDRMRVENGEFQSIRIYLEQEPGSAGVDVIDHYTRKVLVGHAFYPDKVTGSKAERAAPLSSTAQAGNVYLIPGTWDLNGYLDELEAFPEGVHKDRVDASSGAHRMLTKSRPPIGGYTVYRTREI